MGNITPRLTRITVATRDLHSAAQDFELLLGFGPDRRSYDGTRQAVFQLQNTAVELLAPGSPGPGGDALAAHLDSHGEGLFGLAFGVGTLDAFAAHLQDSGATVATPAAGDSSTGDSGVSKDRRALLIPPHYSRGIRILVEQNDAPPQPQSQQSAANATEHAITAVDHVVINTANGDNAADCYGKLLGIRLALRQNMPQWGGDMLFFRCNQMSVEVLANPKNDPQRDSLWGIAFATPVIALTHRRLVDAGIALSELRDGRKPGTRVCTIKSHCLGIPALLLGSSD
jgi:catechol 2,3-dioxygenase-like lactoylglutathione lyase family enzyme